MLNDTDMEKVRDEVKSYHENRIEKYILLINDTINNEHIEINIQSETELRSLVDISLVSEIKRSGARINRYENIVLKSTGEYDRFITLHEAAVFNNCINPMRNYIPNFVYMYGLYEGSDLYDDWKTNGRNIYLAMEYVSSTNLSKFLRTCDMSELSDIFIQSLLSIHMAEDMYGFTHHDLRPPNVMIKESEELLINYVISETTYEHQTQNLAVIIDFGGSYYEKGGKSRGYIQGIETYPVVIDEIYEDACYVNKSHPHKDIYMLFMRSYRMCVKFGREDLIREFFIPIYKVFNKTFSGDANELQKEYELQLYHRHTFHIRLEGEQLYPSINELIDGLTLLL